MESPGRPADPDYDHIIPSALVAVPHARSRRMAVVADNADVNGRAKGMTCND